MESLVLTALLELLVEMETKTMRTAVGMAAVVASVQEEYQEVLFVFFFFSCSFLRIVDPLFSSFLSRF
jgi:hypothetical protein